MKRVMLWVALAMVVVPALRFSAHALDVRAVNQEIARLDGELREIELKIQNVQSIDQEKERAINHWFAIDEQAKRDQAEAQRMTGQPGFDLLAKPLEFYIDRAMRNNPFVVGGGSGATIQNHADLLSYADFVTKSLPTNAQQEIEFLQALQRDKIAELLRLQWHMVAAGIGEDPILGSWKIALGSKGSVVTVRKAPDGGHYIGVIEISTLEHFPRGAELFSVVIDPNNPYNYTGRQHGYTAGRRDTREDEPLRIVVRGNAMLYENRQQRLTWQRFGDKPAFQPTAPYPSGSMPAPPPGAFPSPPSSPSPLAPGTSPTSPAGPTQPSCPFEVPC